jgi:hypothetical protein
MTRERRIPVPESIVFGLGYASPEKPDAYQRRFWSLFSAEAEATAALWRAHGHGGDVDEAMAVRVRARATIEAFLREHPDRAFLVFRPEDIEAALVEGLPSVRLFSEEQ